METVQEYTLKATPTGVTLSASKITSSDDVQKFMRGFWGDDILIYESFFLLVLNRGNVPIGWAKISQGGISGTVVDVRILMKFVIDLLGTSVIVAHNHPSGALRPSTQDLQLTSKLKEGLKMLDIELIDHIILTKDDYYSLADNNYL